MSPLLSQPPQGRIVWSTLRDDALDNGLLDRRRDAARLPECLRRDRDHDQNDQRGENKVYLLELVGENAFAGARELRDHEHSAAVNPLHHLCRMIAAVPGVRRVPTKKVKRAALLSGTTSMLAPKADVRLIGPIVAMEAQREARI